MKKFFQILLVLVIGTFFSSLSAWSSEDFIYYDRIKLEPRISSRGSEPEYYSSANVTIYGLSHSSQKLKRNIQFRLMGDYIWDTSFNSIGVGLKAVSNVDPEITHDGNSEELNINVKERRVVPFYDGLNASDRLVFKAICGSLADKNILRPWLNQINKNSKNKYKDYFSPEKHFKLMHELGRNCSSSLPGAKVKFLSKAAKNKKAFETKYSIDASNTSKICDIRFSDFADSITARKELQRSLKGLGLYSGAVDGIFGKNSCKGLKELLKQANQANRNLINFQDINLFLKKSEPKIVQKKPEIAKILNTTKNTIFEFEELELEPSGPHDAKWFSIKVRFKNVKLHELAQVIPEVRVRLDAKITRDYFHSITLREKYFRYTNPKLTNSSDGESFYIHDSGSKSMSELKRFFGGLDAEKQAIFVGICNYFKDGSNMQNILKSIDVPSGVEKFMQKHQTSWKRNNIRDIARNCSREVATFKRSPLTLMSFENLKYRSLKIRPGEWNDIASGKFYTTGKIKITGVKPGVEDLKIRPTLELNFVGNYNEESDFEEGFHGVPLAEDDLFKRVPDSLAHDCCEPNTIFLPQTKKLKKYFEQAGASDKAVLLATCGSLSDPDFVEKILFEMRNAKYMTERYRSFWSSPAHAEKLIERAELCNYELTGSSSATVRFEQIASATSEGVVAVRDLTVNDAERVSALEEKLAKAQANNERINSALLTAIGEKVRLSKELENNKSNTPIAISVLRQSISVKDKEISQKTSSLNQANEDISRLKNELQSHKSLSETLITNLEKKYEDALANTDENSARFNELNGQIEILKQDLKLSDNRLSEQKSAWLGERDKLKSQLSNLKNLDQKQKSDLESIRLENKRLNSELANSVDEIALLKETLDNEKEEIVKLRERTAVAQSNAAQIPQLKEKLKKLEKQLSLQGQLANAQNWRDVAEQDPDWSTWLVDMPLKQMLFCDLVSEYEILLSQALASQNQIRMNLVLKDRKLELDGLLPRGELEGWIGRVNAVTQTADGDAAVLLELPCDVNIGSGITSINGEDKWAATIPYGDRMYRELVKVGKGDFVILNAKLLEVDEGELGQPEYKFASNLANDKNLPDNFKSENETFIAFVNYLVEAKR